LRWIKKKHGTGLITVTQNAGTTNSGRTSSQKKKLKKDAKEREWQRPKKKSGGKPSLQPRKTTAEHNLVEKKGGKLCGRGELPGFT